MLVDNTIVEGAQHRRADAMRFIDRVQRAPAGGFGVLLVREPSNPYDANAIRVDGWIGDPAKARPLGYINRELAAVLAKAPHKLAASLARIFCRGKYIEIQIDVLEPRTKLSSDELLKQVQSGQPFAGYLDLVKALRREKRIDEAVSLLTRLIDNAEREAKRERLPPAPAYYDQLAGIYRKRKDTAAELALLERYEAIGIAPGVTGDKLKGRLAELRKVSDGKP